MFLGKLLFITAKRRNRVATAGSKGLASTIFECRTNNSCLNKFLGTARNLPQSRKSVGRKVIKYIEVAQIFLIC